MTATIEVSTEYNLEKIATIAGNASVEGRLYRDGRLYVEGVTQEALDAALAAYDRDAEMATRDALSRIVRLEALIRENKVAGVPPYLHERHLREMKAELLSFTGSDPELLQKIQDIETQIATLRAAIT